MIAENNQPYAPAPIVLDGIDAFTDQGPMTCHLAGTDRVVTDAVGVALLKSLGSSKAIDLCAAALDLGASWPEEFEIVTSDANSARYADRTQTFAAGVDGRSGPFS